MKKVLKQLLCITLCVLMVITLLPSSAFVALADDEEPQGTAYEMGTDLIPITSYSMALRLSGTNYIVSASRDADGELVVTGMDELNAAYPDGVPISTPVKVTLNFDPKDVDFVEGDTMEYQLPDILDVSHEVSGTVYENDGVTVKCTYILGTDGKIVFTPNPDSGVRFKNGRIEFDATFDESKLNDKHEAPVNIGGMPIDVPIYEEPEVIVDTYSLAKAPFNPNPGAGYGKGIILEDEKGRYLIWGMEVTAGDKNTVNVENVVVRDIIPAATLQYVRKDAEGRPMLEYYRYTGGQSAYQNEDAESRFFWDEENSCWSWNVSSRSKGTYRYMFFKMYLEDTYEEQTLKNTAEAYRNGTYEKRVNAEFKRTINLNITKASIHSGLAKTGNGKPYIDEDGDLCVDYSIYVKAQRYNTEDIYDAVVKDVFTEGGEYIKGIKNPEVYIYIYGAGNLSNSTYGGIAYTADSNTYVKKYKDGKGAYPEEKLPVWDNDTKTLTWIVDKIPVTDSMELGGRYLKFTAVLDWDMAEDEAVSSATLPPISNTATLYAAGKSVSASLTKNISKQWIKKSGVPVTDNTLPRKGAVKYTVELQDSLVVNGHYIVKDFLGEGAEYYDPGDDYPRSLTITRSKKDVVDTTFALVMPIGEGTTVENEDGTSVTTLVKTEAGVTFTLKFLRDANGNQSFELDIPATDDYAYTLEYYAVPTSGNAIGNISNAVSIGKIGDDLEPVWHEYTVDTTVDDSAFIEKECTFISEDDELVSWITTVKHNLKAGATITDYRDRSKSDSGRFYYTDEQIDEIVVMAGTAVLIRDVDYTVERDPSLDDKFTVTMLHDVDGSDDAPVTIEYTAVAEDFDLVMEGGGLTYANKAELVNAGLTASAVAEEYYTRKTHFTKDIATDADGEPLITVENGSLYLTWQFGINEDGDMTGSAVITDPLPEGTEFVSAVLNSEKSGEFIGDVTVESEHAYDEDGIDVAEIRIGGLTKGDCKKVVIDMKTVVTDPEILGMSLDDDDFVHIFFNIADLTYKGITYTEYAGAGYTQKAIKKTGTYSAQTAPYVSFSAVINENGVDIFREGSIDTITVIDEYDSRLEFKRETFTAQALNPETGKYETLSKESLDLDVDTANHTFTFSIPDNRTVKVEYRCTATGEEDVDEYTASNKMSFRGIDSSESESETVVAVTHGSGSIDTVKYLVIKKFNKKGKVLPGAKFGLYEVKVEDNALTYTPADEIKGTAANGTVTFYGYGGITAGLDEDTVYAFREEEAPAGYFLTEETSKYHLFAFKKSAVTDEIKAAYEAEGNDSSDIVVASSSSYSTEYYNQKGEITVKKVFENGKAPNGTFYFALYDSDETTKLETGKITVSGGKVLNDIVFSELDFGPDGSEKTYYVYETDADYNRLEVDNSGRVQIGGMYYTVTGEGAVTISATENGFKNLVTVTNAMEAAYTVEADKILSGGDLTGKTFSFTLTGENVSYTAESDAKGHIVFPEMRYTEAGTYVYKMKEAIPQDAVDGVSGSIRYDETEVTVTVTVSVPNAGGFAVDATYDGDESFTFRNEKLFSIVAEKTWDDSELLGKDGYERPEVTFVLYGKVGDDVAVEKRELTANENSEWKAEFTNLSEYIDGQKVSYFVYENPVEGFTGDATEENPAAVKDGAVTVKNTADTPEEEYTGIEITIKKTDANTGNGLTGAVFTVKDKESGKASDLEATGANGTVKFTFDKPGTYEITEKTAPDHYVKSDDVWTVKVDKDLENVKVTKKESVFTFVYNLIFGQNDLSSFENGMLTVSNEPETVSLEVSKVWEDDNDRDRVRDDVEFSIYADGVFVKKDTLKKGSETLKFTDLPAYKDGQLIKYTVAETAYPEVYESDTTVDSRKEFKDGKATVTNTYTPEKMSFTIIKNWDDQDLYGKDGYERPALTFRYKGLAGSTVVVPVTNVSLPKGETSVAVSGLDRYENGVEIKYYVWEDEASGYTVVGEDKAVLVSDGKATLTNTPVKGEAYTPVSYQLKKTDANTGNGLSGAVFTVKDTGDNSTYDLDPTNADGVVTVTFDKPGTYEVTEKTAPDNYVKCNDTWTFKVVKTDEIVSVELKDDVQVVTYALSLDRENSAELTNDILTVSNEPVKVSLTVEKKWNDDNDRDGLRDDIEFSLYADGTFVKKDTLKKGNTTLTFADLPEYKDGQLITYTVAETAVPEGYTTDAPADSPAAFTDKKATVTNNHGIELTKVTAVKKWNDDDVSSYSFYERPSVMLAVIGKVNGTVVYPEDGASVTKEAAKDNRWTVEFNNLPKLYNGEEIEYYVYEVAVDNYTSDATADSPKLAEDGGVDITNTPVLGQLSVTKKDKKTGAVLSGAVYGVYLDSACTEKVLDLEPTGTDGVSVSKKLPLRSYYVKEIKAPLGYAISDEIFSVSVEKDSIAAVNNGSVEDPQQKGDVTITATKTVDGNVPTADQVFTFTLSGDGIETQEKTNVGSNITFDKISYTYEDKGEHVYTVKELSGAEGYDMDETVYTVTVTVEAGEENSSELKISTVISKNGNTVDAVSFENRLSFGDIEIRKTVKGNAPSLEKKFEFTVTLGDSSITGTYGDAEFTDGVATLEIAADEVKTVTGLPHGTTYEVTEKDYTEEGYISKIEEGSAAGSIVGHEVKKVTFSNERNAEGSITVTKNLTGNDIDPEKKFDIYITLSDTELSGTFSDVEFINGEATVSIAKDETVVIEGLPNGIEFTVGEKSYREDGYDFNGITVNGEDTSTGKVDENAPCVVVVMNERNTYGCLSVTKHVTGKDGDLEKEFNFTVTLGEELSGTYGDMEFTEGVAQFMLADGQTVTAEMLPNGITYVVTEDDYSDEGYDTEMTGEAGVIDDEVEAVCEFENHKEIVNTGDEYDLGGWTASMVLSGLLAAILAFLKMKERENG